MLIFCLGNKSSQRISSSWEVYTWQYVSYGMVYGMVYGFISSIYSNAIRRRKARVELS